MIKAKSKKFQIVKLKTNQNLNLKKTIQLYENIIYKTGYEGFFNLVLTKENMFLNYSPGSNNNKENKKIAKHFNLNLENSEKVINNKFNDYFFLNKNNKKEKTKFNINHIIYKNNFYRSIFFRNFKDFDFNELLESGYFLIQIKKTTLKKSLINDLNKENWIDTNDKINFLKNLEETGEYNFDINYIIKGDDLKDLENKTVDLIKKLSKKNIEIKVRSHERLDFYLKLSKNNFNRLKMLAFLENNNNLEIINYSSTHISKNSIQNLFNVKFLENNIMEYNGSYFDIFSIEDLNYIHGTEDDQENIISVYEDIINSFGHEIKTQLLIQNDLIHTEEVKNNLFAKSNFELNDCYNEYLEGNINKASTESVDKNIYFAITVNKPFVGSNVTKAAEYIKKSYNDLKRNLKSLYSSEKKLNLNMNYSEKLKVLKNFIDYDYKNINKNIEFDKKRELATDYFSPAALKFSRFNTQQSKNFSSSFSIETYADSISDKFLLKLLALPYKINISIRNEYQERDKSISLIENKIFQLETSLDKKTQGNTNSKKFIPHDLRDTYTEALELREEIKKKSKNFIKTYISFTLFDETEEKLEEKEGSIKSILKSSGFKVNSLFLVQEVGLLSTYPLPYTIKKNEQRYLLNDNLSLLHPFSRKKHYDENGIYYGLSEANNILAIIRKKFTNSSGWFLGIPGSGKSFLAKKEMLSVLMKFPKDEIIIIDPEKEYFEMAKNFGGENINVSSNSPARINPFDITTDLKKLLNPGDDNPLKLKQEFLITFIDLLSGGMSQRQKSISDLIIGKLYQKYIEKLKTATDRSKVKKPTLKTFSNELLKEASREAIALNESIGMHVQGTLNIFADETNVQTHKRFINFNIKSLGEELKDVGLLLICELLWNRLEKNREKGVNTWVYIDEIHLLLKHEASSKFLFKFFKRVRKYGGVPTGITQNISDLLQNDTANTMFSNSEFIVVMKQSKTDAEILQDLFDLSHKQIKNVLNNPPGSGMMLLEGEPIPFHDDMDTNLELYKIMTTRMSDIQNKQEAS